MAEAAALPGGPGVDRRTWLIGGALMAATLPLLLRPSRQERLLGANRLDEIVPMAIGPWRAVPSDDIVMPDALEGSPYEDVVERGFAGPGVPPVMLVIAYGRAANRRLTIHDPVVCYGSQGFTVRDHNRTAVALGGDVRVAGWRMTADRAERHEDVLYWRRIGDDAINDDRAELALYYRRALSGVSPDGVLVRMSTIGDPSPATHAALARFARTLIAACSPAGRLVLLGPSAAARVGRGA